MRRVRHLYNKQVGCVGFVIVWVKKNEQPQVNWKAKSNLDATQAGDKEKKHRDGF